MFAISTHSRNATSSSALGQAWREVRDVINFFVKDGDTLQPNSTLLKKCKPWALSTTKIIMSDAPGTICFIMWHAGTVNHETVFNESALVIFAIMWLKRRISWHYLPFNPSRDEGYPEANGRRSHPSRVPWLLRTSSHSSQQVQRRNVLSPLEVRKRASQLRKMSIRRVCNWIHETFSELDGGKRPVHQLAINVVMPWKPYTMSRARHPPYRRLICWTN